MNLLHTTERSIIVDESGETIGGVTKDGKYYNRKQIQRTRFIIQTMFGEEERQALLEGRLILPPDQAQWILERIKGDNSSIGDQTSEVRNRSI